MSLAAEVFIDAVGGAHRRAGSDARIACLVPSITELVCALGLGGQLVARTGFCVHPRPELDAVPKVGGTKDVDLERLRRLRPSHVIVNVDENDKPVVDRIAEFVPHVIVTHPKSPQDNFELYRLLGGIFGCPERAEALCSALSEAIDVAQARCAGMPRERVLYLIWKAPWMTVARDTYISRTLAAVGWDTIPEHCAVRYPQCELESLAPQVDRVLLSSEPYRFGSAHVAELQARFKTQHRNERDAWRELAPAWKLELDASDPCREALKRQVHCYRSSSTLALIRQLGRPGIVTLYDDDNRPIFALLTGLSGRTATLRMGGTVQTVSLVSLAGMWRGEFATLWRAPSGYAPRAVETPPRALAEWLTTQLGSLTGAAPAPGGAAGGAALKSRVIAFQLAQGLKPDGLVGPTTLMQLNRAIGIDEPRLDTEG